MGFKNRIQIAFLALLLAANFYGVETWAQAAPSCGRSFLEEFKKHYSLFECLSRNDKVCISDVVNSNSTITGVPVSGAVGAGASKLASGLKDSSNKLAQFVGRKASTTAGAAAWGAIAGGTYFLATKALGAVVGFLADTTPLNDPCNDSGLVFVLREKKDGKCVDAYRTTDNPVVADFLKIDNASLQLTELKDPRTCKYFRGLHALLRTQGKMVASQQGVTDPTLFESQENSVGGASPAAAQPSGVK